MSGAFAPPQAEGEVAPEEDVPVLPRRGFAALHRDTWRILLRAPLLNLGVPLLACFLVELGLSSVARSLGVGPESQEMLVGAAFLPLSILLAIPCALFPYATARRVGRGEATSISAVLTEVSAIRAEGLRAVSGFMAEFVVMSLLLLIPGLFVGIRKAFYVPRVLLGDVAVDKARRNATSPTVGHRWRIAGFWLLFASIYQGIASGLSALAAKGAAAFDPAAGWAELLAYAAGYAVSDVVMVGSFLGAGLMWLDTTNRMRQAPLGREPGAPEALPGLIVAALLGLAGWGIWVPTLFTSSPL